MASADSSERRALTTQKKASLPKKPAPKKAPASRPPGYTTGAKIVPGPRKVTGYEPANPPYGVLIGRPGKAVTKPTVKMQYNPGQKPMGRPTKPTKPRNKGLSQPDRAEGYGKPGGRWVNSGRTQLVVPKSNWDDADSQITKRNIPKFVTQKPMGRPNGAQQLEKKKNKRPRPASDGYDTTRSQRQGSKPPAKKKNPPKLIDVYVNGRIVKMPTTSPKQGQRGREIPRIPGAY